MRAKKKFGCASHTMHTADEMFMGVQFKPDGETRKYRVSGTVPTNDASSMTLFQATALRGEQTIEIAKQLSSMFVASASRCMRCAPSARPSRTHLVAISARARICAQDLKLKLQSRRFVLFLAFLIDMHAYWSA